MQTLVCIDYDDDSVIIQTADKVYSETYQNFIHKDGGNTLPVGIKSIDYNKSIEHCWINGKAFQTYPNKYADVLLKNIDNYISSKKIRDRKKEEEKNTKIFERYNEEFENMEKERIENLSDEELEQEMIDEYCSYAQEVLDNKAREKMYDNMNSLCSYIGSSNEKFSKEARLASDWRDSVWEQCYILLDKVKNGQIEKPTKELFLMLLPEFNWEE